MSKNSSDTRGAEDAGARGAGLRIPGRVPGGRQSGQVRQEHIVETGGEQRQSDGEESRRIDS